MTHLEAISLGLVQGVAEFLPISSSGHLVVVQQLFNFSEANLIFDVWLHVATTLAVVIFFRKKILSFSAQQWLVVALASLPAAVIGLAFNDIIESLFSSVTVVALALLLTAMFNFWSNWLLKHAAPALNEVSPKKGLLVGFMQALAIIPGISRSGSTVFAGLKLGLNRETAFSFSFILSIPAILGAGLLQLLKLDSISAGLFSVEFLVGGLAALIAAFASLFLLKKVIVNSKLNYFGWYCLLLSGALLVFA